jgi:hypothetical protein
VVGEPPYGFALRRSFRRRDIIVGSLFGLIDLIVECLLLPIGMVIAKPHAHAWQTGWVDSHFILPL